MPRSRVPAIWKVLAVILRPPFHAIARTSLQGGAFFPAPGEPVIVAVNHITNLDWLPVAEMFYLRRTPPAILVKHSLFRIPVVGAVLRRLGLIPVERGSERASQALAAAEKALGSGRVIVFFPEGTLTADPDLWPMSPRPGVARLALATGAPVVPLAVWGTQEVLPRGRALPRPFPRRTVRLKAGPPVDLSDFASRAGDPGAAREATAKIMAAVTALVADLRGEDPPASVFDPRNNSAR